jgi:hypothetical protein
MGKVDVGFSWEDWRIECDSGYGKKLGVGHDQL